MPPLPPTQENRGALMVLLVCVCWGHAGLSGAAATPVANKTGFIVGVDVSQASYTETFQGTLTSIAGSRFTPPLSFAVSPLRNSLLQGVSVADLDFVFGPADVISCLALDNMASPLSTVKDRKGAGASLLTGGVVFAKASNAAVTGFASLSGQKVSALGSQHTLAFDACEAEARAAASFSLVQNTSLVAYSAGAPSDVIGDVMEGKAAAGVLEAGDLEAHAASSGSFSMSDVKIIGSKAPAVAGIAVSGFPWATSTGLYPGWTLAWMPGVDSDVTKEVRGALSALNASSPQAVAGGYDSFGPAQSLGAVRDLQRGLGRIVGEGGGACRGMASTCPPGMLPKSLTGTASLCEGCPAGRTCQCKPCVEGVEVEVRPMEGREEPCVQWDMCGGGVEQLQQRGFSVVDRLGRAGFEFSVRMEEGAGGGLAGQCEPQAPTPEGFSNCTFRLMVKQEGVHTMVIRLDGEVMGVYYLPTELRTCDPSFQGDKEEAVWVADDLTGECGCATNTIPAGGLCWRIHELIPIVVLVPLAFLAACFLVILKRQDTAYQSSWKIPASKVTVDEPPQVLGTGTFGEVVIGKYGGRDVAIKRVYPTCQDMTHFVQFVKEMSESKKKNTLNSDSLHGNESPMVGVVRKGSGSVVARIRRASMEPGAEQLTQARRSAEPERAEGSAPAGFESAIKENEKSKSADDSFKMKKGLLPVAATAELPASPSARPPTGSSADSKAADMLTTKVPSSGSERARTPSGTTVDKIQAVGSSGSERTPLTNRVDQSPSFGPRKKSIIHALHTRVSPSDLEMGPESMSQSGKVSDYMKLHIKRLSQISDGHGSSFDLERPDLLLQGHAVLPGQKPEDVLRHQLDHKFHTEIRIVTRLKHPCLVSIIGAIVEPKSDPLILLEVCENGCLADVLQNRSVPMEAWMLMPIMKDVVRGMRYLHAVDPPIVHGDLRTAKIMIDSGFRAKVADFGFTQKRRIGLSASKASLAPEIIKDIGNIPTMQSDVYAFGILLCELFSREEPYAGENLDDVLKQVQDLSKDPPKRPKISINVPRDVDEVIHWCWDNVPANRPTFEVLDNQISRMDISGVNSIALKLQQQQRQTNNVMYDVFPKHIADQLLAGKKVAPEHRPVVTIFFSDIVGFTDISGTLSPEKVSKMLDRLYTKFDDLANYYDVFKVETIGDAYMAVTNLVKDQNRDHCARIARFGLAAIKAAKETIIDEDDPERGTVNIRVGFHTGPIVANVVGNKNPRYCLFGDTVNTSSRMESNSIKGRVHCTKLSADVLRRQAAGMQIEERGELEIKGKGKMTTYWVNGEDTEKTERTDKTAAAGILVGATVLKTANKRLKGLRRASVHRDSLHNALGNSTTVTMLQGRYKAKMQALSAFTGMHRAQTAKKASLQAVLKS